MFTLIITIIAIALVAALAVASLYYGGSAFTQGTAKAEASALVAQAQQISAANDLFANDNAGSFATATTDLTSNGYLSAWPQIPASVGGIWALTSATEDQETATITNIAVCNEVNAEAQGTASGTTPAMPATVSSATTQFGCAGTTSGTSFTVFYSGS